MMIFPGIEDSTVGKVDLGSEGFRSELKAAVFAGGFGIVVWLAVQYGGTVIPGTGLDNDGKRLLALLFVIAALIHSLAIKWYGFWTPALRLIAMLIHAWLFAYIAATNNSWAAVYTYGCISVAMFYAALNAAQDAVKLYRG